MTQSGVDLISGLFDNDLAMEAYERGRNGYYDSHEVPEGFAKEDLILTDASIDRAVIRTLTEMFALGMFEDPYRDRLRQSVSLQMKLTGQRQHWRTESLLYF